MDTLRTHMNAQHYNTSVHSYKALFLNFHWVSQSFQLFYLLEYVSPLWFWLLLLPPLNLWCRRSRLWKPACLTSPLLLPSPWTRLNSDKGEWGKCKGRVSVRVKSEQSRGELQRNFQLRRGCIRRSQGCAWFHETTCPTHIIHMYKHMPCWD